MKLFFTFLFFIFMTVTVKAEQMPVRLVVDGVDMPNLSAPPIILNNRTLVPMRDVFERVGGVIGWHDVHRQVTLYYGEDVLILTIDDFNAIFNGNIIEMDVPAIIHNDRTMIPLRFPAEIFGFHVDWDAQERKATVNSNGSGNNGTNVDVQPDTVLTFAELPEIPLPPRPGKEIEFEYDTISDNEELPWESVPGTDELPPPGITVSQTENNTNLAVNVSSSPIQTMAFSETTITGLLTPVETGTAAYTVTASSAISEVNHFLLPDNRLVVDIHNAVALISGDFVAPPNVPVSGVRASQFSQTPRVTRVVFDVVGSAEYSISLSADRNLLTVSFSQNRITGILTYSDAYSDTMVIQGDVLPTINISTENFPEFITLNIENSTMEALDGFFANGIYATDYTVGQRDDGSSFIRIFVRDNWPSFSLASSANSVAFMMHRGVSGIRYDSVNRELRISREFYMNIHTVEQIDDYLNFRYTFILPPEAEVLGRGDISVLDGFVNSVALAHDDFGNVHLSFNMARVLTFSVDEDAEHYIIRAHLPRDTSPFIVVIDPGHGGFQPGAIHNGVVEKDLALSVSEMIENLLEADPFITTYMTRRDDSYVSLLSRAEFANNIDADLFISIHANAAEIRRGVLNPEVHGIETWYTVSELEKAENHRTDSRRFAEIIQRNKIRVSNANDRGIKNAPNFVVLRETKMPSVLLELGFLTNPAEAARLNTTEYQTQLAQAIYQGILETIANIS